MTLGRELKGVKVDPCQSQIQEVDLIPILKEKKIKIIKKRFREIL